MLYGSKDTSDRYPEIDEKASLINNKTKSDAFTSSVGSAEVDGMIS